MIVFAVIAFVLVRRPSRPPEPTPVTLSKSPALEDDDAIVGFAQAELVSKGAASAVKACGVKLVGAEFEGQMVFKTLAGSIAVASLTLEAKLGDAGVLADPTQLECVKKSLSERTASTTGPGSPRIPEGREYEVAFSLTLPPVQMGYGN